MEKITEITRRDIFDLLIKGGRYWYYGGLDEVSFLKRLCNLRNEEPISISIYMYHADLEAELAYYMRTHGHGYVTQIIFQNPRFCLSDGEDSVLLKFLCEVFHPAVRIEKGEWAKLLCQVNELLKPDGYEIYENGKMSGRSIYGWRLLQNDNSIIHEQCEKLVKSIDTEYVQGHIEKMQNLIDSSPDDAIGKAKELLEIISKSILDDLGVSYDNNDNVSKLMKKAYEAINLTPEQVPQDAQGAKIAAKILGSLSGITQGMAELRNEFGGGHGKGKNFKPLPPRYAHLAVGAAGTVVNFMWDTYTEKKSSNKD